MPGFVSLAQRRKWEQLRDEGRVTVEQFQARELETPADVPERASPRTRTVGASRSTDAAQVGKTRY
jgi:hypothetical protein